MWLYWLSVYLTSFCTMSHEELAYVSRLWWTVCRLVCVWVCCLTCLYIWSATVHLTYDNSLILSGRPSNVKLICFFFLGLNSAADVLKHLKCLKLFLLVLLKQGVWNTAEKIKCCCCVLLIAFLLCGICPLCWSQSKRQIIRWVRGSSILSSTVPLWAWELPHT